MNYERPVVKTDPNSTLRNRNMTVKKAEVKPNNILKAQPIETKVAQFKDLNFDNVDPDNYDDVLLWLKDQVNSNPRFSFNDYNVIEIDEAGKIITVFNKRTQKKERRSLVGFINMLKEGIKNATGENKIGGKVVDNDTILGMIESDIKKGRTFKGKLITSIDYEAGKIYLKSNDAFGLEESVPLTEFISSYKKIRKLGQYGDTIETEQQIEQDIRQRNLEDMTEAFRTALGIKPPKVKYFVPLKIHRGVAQLPNQYRDYNYHWTDDEIKQVHRLGRTPNPPVKVSGDLHDYFNPIPPQPQEARDFVAQKEIAYMSKVSSRES